MTDVAAMLNAYPAHREIVDDDALVLSRLTGFDAEVARTVVKACEVACRSCFLATRRHGLEYEHCRICAEACRRCAGACRRLLAGLT
jgi:hypothetical protein